MSNERAALDDLHRFALGAGYVTDLNAGVEEGADSRAALVGVLRGLLHDMGKREDIYSELPTMLRELGFLLRSPSNEDEDDIYDHPDSSVQVVVGKWMIVRGVADQPSPVLRLSAPFAKPIGVHQYNWETTDKPAVFLASVRAYLEERLKE